MYIVGNIKIYGTLSALEFISKKHLIRNGLLQRVGSERKPPDQNSWRYGTPNYQFGNIITLDEDVHDFLTDHIQLESVLNHTIEGVTSSVFTLMPIDQSFEHMFSCLLTRKTLRIMMRIGLDFQISPEVIMPDAVHWR